MARRPIKNEASRRRVIARLIATLQPRLRQAFIDAMSQAKSNIILAEVESKLLRGDIEGALEILRIDDIVFNSVIEEVRNAYLAFGTSTSEIIPSAKATSGRVISVRFDIRDPVAEQWLKDSSSTLIAQIKAEELPPMRRTLEKGLANGRNPHHVAIDIAGQYDKKSGRRVGGIIGLGDQKVKWRDNAYEELLSNEPSELANYLTRKRRDKRFDSVVERAIRTGEPIPISQITKMIRRYEDGLLKFRGEQIAQNEMLSSLEAGTYEAYRQAIAKGAVSRDSITVTWITSAKENVRDTHSAQHREVVPFGQPFPNGLHYPHEKGAPAEEVVNCKCSAYYRIDYLAQAAEL